MVNVIGKCSHCENTLKDTDIIENKFKGSIYIHHAYVCKHCGKIIGFSSLNVTVG
jgi:DNA-directed RNA polymerase subunit RPC12/RpoP